MVKPLANKPCLPFKSGATSKTMLTFVTFAVDIFRYTLSEAWSGVNRADLVAAQGAFGTDFHDRSILRPKHRAYYRSGRPVIKIGPKSALGSHEIRPIHSAPSLGQSIDFFRKKSYSFIFHLNTYHFSKAIKSVHESDIQPYYFL